MRRWRFGKPRPEAIVLMAAAAIGAIGALADALFRGAIGFVHHSSHPAGITTRQEGVFFWVIALPAVGGLLVAILRALAKREVGGYGLPDLLVSVNLRDAVLSTRTTLLRTLAAVLTLGSGGSAGVEGPLAALGAGVGSATARALRIVGDRAKLLVACGSSAAIASAYGAPITGVFFTQEIVLAGNYDLRNFVPVVVASAVSTIVARGLRGDAPLFTVEPFELRTGGALVFYLLLGLLSGVVGPAFARLLYATRDRFQSSSLPVFWKPAVGGAFVGLIAIAYPAVLGDGATYVQRMLLLDTYPGGRVMLLLLGLVVAKCLATSITLGSGGAGGVFGPSVFLGATLGTLIGSAALRIAPSWVGPSSQFALIGIGAMLAATTRAPLTSIFLVFELTGSSATAVLPGLIAVAAAILVASRIERHSIDEMELARRGIVLAAGREAATLHGTAVSSAMSSDVERIPASTPAPGLLELLRNSRRNAFIVEDPEGRMVGLLTLADLRNLTRETAETVGALAVASDIATQNVIVTHPDASLADALAKIDRHGFRQLVVVAAGDPTRAIGMLERRHVLSAYGRALLPVPPDAPDP